jgi:selenocysteine lyase/cysteine desulfurase
MTLDSKIIRNEFPALSRPVLFLDNPGGTQITRRSLDRIQDYLINKNANHGGSFETSRLSDSLVEETRSAAADFLNAARPEEIVLGPNMTSLTFNISRALARTFNPGDTIIVTRLDHDANISPWLLVAEDRGCKIRWVDFHPEDCTLDQEDFRKALEEKPKLVALGYSSNAVGTINPMAEMVKQAHAAGALVYIDAVQYAPHGPIDVQDLDCDFLVCSAYKYFGLKNCALTGCDLRLSCHRESLKPEQEISNVCPELWVRWNILNGSEKLLEVNLKILPEDIPAGGRFSNRL